ncbi:MAG: cyanoexosortase A system-associated protein [Spirulina sp. SIO3F2]|nr:cyanoexosortase A system-associated protein [Spirulina sp. SIO3F2]
MSEQNPELAVSTETSETDTNVATTHPDSAPQAAVTPPASPRWRWGILVVNALLLGIGVAWVTIDPKVGRLQSYEFPEAIELETAAFKSSDRLKPVEKPEYEGSSYIAGRHYQYRDRNQPLDIEIRYVIDTEGGVDKFTREHEQIEGFEKSEDLIAQIKRTPETGHYALLQYQDRTYISACINPRGKTTASHSQYLVNQQLYDTVIERVGVWLLGRQRWRDDRCLWTIMYTPTGDDAEVSEDRLEAAWAEWVDHWQANFPAL